MERAFEIRESEAFLQGIKNKSEVDAMWMDLRLGYELMDFSVSDMLSHKFTVKQELPLWGKTGLKREIADKDFKAAGFALADKKNLLKKMLRDGLSEYFFALRIKAVREEEMKFLTDFVEIVKIKYLTDGARPAGLIRAEIRLAETGNMILMTETMRATAKNTVFDIVDIEELDASIGNFSIKFEKNRVLELDPGSLFIKARAHLPAVANLDNEILKIDKEIELAKAGLFPNLMVESSFATTPSSRTPGRFSVGVEVNLSIFSASGKNAMVRMKESEKQERVMKLSGLKNDLLRLIQRKTIEAANLVRQIELYETQILSLQSSSTDTLLAAYAVDKAEFEMVMDALLMAFDSKNTYYQYQRKLIGILAELEYLTGEDLFTLDDGVRS
jgi:outer membrane protein TolC